MKTILARLHAHVRGVALATALLFLAVVTFAGDKVTLKDGRVLDGTITRELEGYVWIKYKTAGIEEEKMFSPSEIAKIERASNTPASAAPVAAAAAAPAPSGGVPRATVITLGDHKGESDMVGLYMTAYALKECIPMLEEELGKDKSGVVVFRISSGGGALSEIQKLSDVIHNDYKQHWRTVAWIDSAISAAAMTSHVIEEIYFTPQGNYGACTGWSGQLVAVKGFQLEQVLGMMERISRRGGYDPLIMRGMQIQQPLSATINADGEVKWYDNAKDGEIVVNRDKEILTFNEYTARQVKFSKGTASTLGELTKLMGYQELNWVGKEVKNVAWPVSKAEAWTMKYRAQVKQDETRFNEYRRSYQDNVAAAAGAPLADRGKFVNKAREALNKMKAMVRNNPAFLLFNFGMETEQFKEWLEEREKTLRDLMK